MKSPQPHLTQTVSIHSKRWLHRYTDLRSPGFCCVTCHLMSETAAVLVLAPVHRCIAQHRGKICTQCFDDRTWRECGQLLLASVLRQGSSCIICISQVEKVTGHHAHKLCDKQKQCSASNRSDRLACHRCRLSYGETEFGSTDIRLLQ